MTSKEKVLTVYPDAASSDNRNNWWYIYNGEVGANCGICLSMDCATEAEAWANKTIVAHFNGAGDRCKASETVIGCDCAEYVNQVCDICQGVSVPSTEGAAELLPCPFCGAGPRTRPTGEEGEMLYIYCPNPDCEIASVEYETQRAIAAWNHRVAAPIAPAAAESCATIDYCTPDEIAEGEERAASIDDDELRSVLAQTEAILLHLERRPSAEAEGWIAVQAENERLKSYLNTPETNDFFAGIEAEAAHQRYRWPSENDAGKTPADWFWLVGYLAGKCLAAHIAGNTEKAQHHTISTAAALANWHRAIKGAGNMRPGTETPAEALQESQK